MSAVIRGIGRGFGVLVFLVTGFASRASGGASPAATETPGSPVFRLGFSSAMFVASNEADAKAAIKIWATSIGRERSIPADPEPRLYPGADAVGGAVARAEVDAVAMSVEEYSVLRDRDWFDRALAASRGTNATEQYVLVVQRASDYRAPADLKGKRLAVFRSPRMGLATFWLDCELARAGQRATSDHFATVVESAKLPKAVLPVYFNNVEACLVTRYGYDTMVEMNPQLGRDLRVLVQSAAYVPGGFFFRKEFDAPLKEKCLAEFERVDRSVSGQQVLTIFQSPKVTEVPLSAFEAALDLLREHARLCPETHTERIEAIRRPAPVLDSRAKP